MNRPDLTDAYFLNAYFCNRNLTDDFSNISY